MTETDTSPEAVASAIRGLRAMIPGSPVAAAMLEALAAERDELLDLVGQKEIEKIDAHKASAAARSEARNARAEAFQEASDKLYRDSARRTGIEKRVLDRAADLLGDMAAQARGETET